MFVEIWIPDVDVRRMNQYVVGLVQLLQRPEGPDELGINQLCDELDQDSEMYSAVWAHLHSWQRGLIKDIRAKNDQ